MVNNDNSFSTPSLKKVEQKRSLTPRPVPQTEPTKQPANYKPSKTQGK